MFPQHFFHPDHVVPLPEFVGAVVEGAYQRVAHVFVEFLAAVVQVGAARFWRSDAGVDV